MIKEIKKAVYDDLLNCTDEQAEAWAEVIQEYRTYVEIARHGTDTNNDHLNILGKLLQAYGLKEYADSVFEVEQTQ